MKSIDTKVEPIILTSSEGCYIQNHPGNRYEEHEISFQEKEYELCLECFRQQAKKMGAEVVTDFKEAFSIKPDELSSSAGYSGLRFEFFISMRGTALIPRDKNSLGKENADENTPQAFSTL